LILNLERASGNKLYHDCLDRFIGHAGARIWGCCKLRSEVANISRTLGPGLHRTGVVFRGILHSNEMD